MNNPVISLITAVAKQYKLDEPTQLMFLGGYLSQKFEGADAEKLSEAIMRFGVESTLPIDVLKTILCNFAETVDTNDGKDGSFSAYMADVVTELKKIAGPSDDDVPPQPKPVKPAPSAFSPECFNASVTVPADITCEIDSLLKSDRPLTTVDLGGSLFNWNTPLDDGRCLYLQVDNAEPTPALAVHVTKKGRPVYMAPAIRYKQWKSYELGVVGKDGTKAALARFQSPSCNLAVDFLQ